MNQSIFEELLNNNIYSLQSAKFSLSGHRIAPVKNRVEIHHIHDYVISPPNSLLEFEKTIEDDIFVMCIKRVVDKKFSHKWYGDQRVFNSLLEYDHTSLEGSLELVSGDREEEYNFKILRPGNFKNDQSFLLTTYIICGGMVPVEEITDDSFDRFDFIVDEEL